MNPTKPSEEELFIRALALPTPERTAYLAQACGGDSTLCARVKLLLRAHEEARGFMEAPPADGLANALTQQAAALEEKPGERIGRYKLLQKLGEGGCGVVYVAEQEEPVRRRVALKVIKLGMDTREVIARFEAERQALAMMDHPNIAKVLDAGATDTGRPFFVMELVRGIPITKFCDEQNATTAGRLELFVQICHAVQHAHQKGIIHRDLKPSNILVTINDGVPVPKVIDFGIAKATQGRLTDATLFTAFEQFIGTPAYMSPEQAVMTSLDIDTRSDIYSLGVLLYELLTGRTPFDARELMAAGLDEIRRRIREVEPPKPSTRLSTMEGEALTSAARLRHTEAPKLISLIRGDLDWIVMRCLEKDRTRRYETANGLAEDIRRHLASEPVLASPPSTAYRLEKLVRRHRTAFAAAAAIAAALLLGALIATWQAIRATRAEHRAQTERAQADAARQLAERRGTEVETINKLLLSDTLTSANPEYARGRDITVREVLDNAALRLPKAFADNPLLEAAIRASIGVTYSRLSIFDKAETHLLAALETRRRLLGEEHPDTLTLRRELGGIRANQNRLEEAEPLLRKTLTAQERVLGVDHEETLRTLSELFNTLALRLQFPRPGDDLKHIHAERGEVARQGYERARQRFGPEHRVTLLHRQNLQFALSRSGQLAEAAVLAQEIWETRCRVLGAEHPDTIESMMYLGISLGDTGKKDQAEKIRREGLALAERVLGPDHNLTGQIVQHLGWQLRSAGRLAEGNQLLRRAVVIWFKAYGPENNLTVRFTLDFGLSLVRDIGPEEAAAFALELLPDLRRRLPAGKPGYAALLFMLGHARLVQGQVVPAEEAFRECAQIMDGFMPEDQWRFRIHRFLGESLLAQKRFAEAETWLLRAHEGFQAQQDKATEAGKGRIRVVLARLVRLYTEWGKPAQAAEWQKKLDAATPKPVSGAVLERKAPVNLSFNEPAADGTARSAEGGWTPVGWQRSVNKPERWEITAGNAMPPRKPLSVSIKATGADRDGFGGLGQSFATDDYRGKRVRFSAWIKTEAAEPGAHLYLRFNRQDGRLIVIDNMTYRYVKGTADWTQAAIVMDVPAEAAAIGLGFFLRGTGQAWFNDTRFEVVGSDVPPTKRVATPAAAKTTKTTGK